MAVEHLKKKYGNKELLIRGLIERLERCRGKSRRLEDQKRLCEELSSIAGQMELQGEKIDSAILQKQILSKFNEDIQRHAIRKKQELPEGENWCTKKLLSEVYNRINAEMEIQSQVEFRDDRQAEKTPLARQNGRRPPRDEHSQQGTGKNVPICFYCDRNDHAPRNCTKFRSRAERLEVIKKRSLCRNCGGPNHMASECQRGRCRICEKPGHHTSICDKLTVEKGPKTRKPTSRTKPSGQARQHFVTSASPERDEQPDEFETIVCMKNTDNHSRSKEVLIGAVQVLNPTSETMERVHVLLDTGADRSFISEDLASRLRLQTTTSVTLSINTFGSDQPIVKRCGISELQVWDAKGEPHRFSVARIANLIEPLQRSELTRDDKRFLADHDIQLSVGPQMQYVRPDVLLGCSDVFALLHGDGQPMWRLPSGIQLIPSRLGYLVAGRLRSEDSSDSTMQDAMTASAAGQEEVQNWQRFLALESAELHDFSDTKAKEQERIDEAVWERFESSIELKENGYHVRFPWTEGAELLPDNRQLAYRRLCSTIERLQATPDVLQQYNQNFVDQVNKGILEEVTPDQDTSGSIIHYLAHQAVCTPEKEFTKLRVVYDASAHLREKPSLNDVLLRGPVMLSTMLHMLLRFRVGQVALIADVEKAFLQVHLHEQDRNAVRWLWVKDLSRPAIGSNIVEYRFTRVPFGLKCSPFLLGGTIKHHLNSVRHDKELAQEILDNVYVDNVILTASSADEATRKYFDSKRIFREMHMNLRGFHSNSEVVNNAIKEEDRSSQKKPKVLGITGESAADHLLVTVHFAKREGYTKRIVSEQVASIFDPMGWLTLLLLKGKLFLQTLWQNGYEWDTMLSKEHQLEWKKITEAVSGYQVRLPRMIATQHATTALAIFADASSSAMAACAYLIQDSDSHLLFAKTRLPNPKDRPTVPKMEINATTLAARIAHMLFQALKKKVRISSITIFSDSKIILCWLATYPIKEKMGKLVKNRVAEIRKIIQNIEVPVRFGYVDTHQNPADCATRGLNKEEAINHIWWTGTAFLKWPEDKWPERSEHFELPQDINGEIIREPPEEVDKQNALEEVGCATVSTSPEIKM
ncbi:unnamed protein product [Heligmosomoides polygyrus]|uniref:CCHC-type domain-containing protein n=1 Tax=Heligmosomoides polygyrus TaxID=6339 RepID=A0A183FZ75_HELPZ|nr:unnamed protein product [Heligmosomoides polygyrus]